MVAKRVRREEEGVQPLAPFFATFSEDRFFDAFWSSLGSLLVAFGLLLALFWDLGIPKT